VFRPGQLKDGTSWIDLLARAARRMGGSSASSTCSRTDQDPKNIRASRDARTSCY
jgi:hypothetical protein